MEKLLYILLATKQAVKQYHWLAKSYQEHILADQLEDGLEGYIDEVAELLLVTDESANVGAKYLLERAENYLNGKTTIDLLVLWDLFADIMQQAQMVNDEEKVLGIADLTGRLSNLALRKMYLIKLQTGK